MRKLFWNNGFYQDGVKSYLVVKGSGWEEFETFLNYLFFIMRF